MCVAMIQSTADNQEVKDATRLIMLRRQRNKPSKKTINGAGPLLLLYTVVTTQVPSPSM